MKSKYEAPMKAHILTLLCLTCALLFGCEHDENVATVPKLRVESMSHGKFQYRVNQYDDLNRISAVILGTIGETSDSSETLYNVTYQGDLVQRIASIDGSHTFDYSYVEGKLTESREYIDHHLETLNQFFYDATGHVDLWVTKQASGQETVPRERKAYRYDAMGNAVSMELEIYDPVTKGHEFISTSKFLDFDDKKNSGSLFINLYNPYHIQFRNNARTWRVENTNGSVGETHFVYEYNTFGYATNQRDLDGGLEIKYQFSRY
jgi:hypothetical protein